MLTIRHILGDRVTVLEREDAGDALHAKEGVVWVDLVEPVADEQSFLRHLGLDELVVDDFLEEDLHPKVDHYPEYKLLVAHGIDVDETTSTEVFTTLELDIVIGRHCLVTHAPKRLPSVGIVSAQLDRDPEMARTTDRLLYEILDAMVDRYLSLFEQIDDRIDALEDALMADRPSAEVRTEIFQLRRTVARLQRIALPQAQTVAKLAALAGDRVDDGERAERLYRDLADKLNRIADLTASYRAQLDGALDQYQTAVANAQNEIMKVLTMVSVILLPITVIAGIYGMNFDYMPELRAPWAYPAVWVLIVAIVVAILTAFRRAGWIGGKR